jgi:hypothetical protein
MKTNLIAAACLVCMGCSSSEGTGSTTSSLTGTLARESFSSEPARVVATDEQGNDVSAVPDAGGLFTLTLAKGHKYKLEVVLASGSEPIVFPRISGALDRSFRVSSGAAIVNLGAVRHIDAAPSGGFVVRSLVAPPSPPASSGADDKSDGECENGVDAVSGNACVDDLGSMTCENGPGDDGADGECENGVDAQTGKACSDPVESTDAADGECENGVDKSTGAPCVDPEEADPNEPMAIAEHNVPDDVGGCNDSEGEESDD